MINRGEADLVLQDSEPIPTKIEPVLSSAHRTLQSGPLNIDILAKDLESYNKEGDKTPPLPDNSRQPKLDFENRSSSPITK